MSRFAVEGAPRPPDIVKAAYAALVVSDLAASRWVRVDMPGFAVSDEDASSVYRRS